MAKTSENTATHYNTELELGGEKMRALVDQAMDRIVTFIESLPSQPASDTSGGEELARSLMEPIPEKGTPFPELLDLLFQNLIPKSYNTAGPGYLAYIPGGGIFHAAVADLIANAVNRYVGVWAGAPGLSQLETNVIRWFCDLVGYPGEARGILTTGGSMANLTALITARRNRLPENFFSGIVYTSDQVHHSIVKAALMAGFPESNIRSIPPDGFFRLRADILLEHIHRDRKNGLTPFLVVGSAGTVNTGAVDDLQALAQITRSEQLWLHVDAAYGGFFVLTERGREALRGIEQADSITLDPHKALFLPYGTGCLLVKDGAALKTAHAVHAQYLPPTPEDPDLVDFSLYSPELSRPFRGVRIWLPLKMHGVGPFRQNLDEKWDLTRWATEELRKIPEIEIVSEPQLSIVTFRLEREGMSPEASNRLNRRLLENINAKKRVLLTATMLDDRFVLRICVLSFRTHIERVQAAIDDIRSSIEEV